MAPLGPQADSKGLRNPFPRREVALEALTNRSSGHIVVISCRSWGRLVVAARDRIRCCGSRSHQRSSHYRLEHHVCKGSSEGTGLSI
eukprot:4724336-Pyramimonas_sp.AAC.1